MIAAASSSFSIELKSEDLLWAAPRPIISHEWNFNVQRQLGTGNVFTMTYLGSAERHIRISENINEGSARAKRCRTAETVSETGGQHDGAAVGASSYHSLQTTCERRVRNGISLLGAWTYSHSIDNSSGTGTETVQTPYSLSLNRGNSTFDVRHSLVLSWNWELPFGRGKKLLGNGNSVVNLLAGG